MPATPVFADAVEALARRRAGGRRRASERRCREPPALGRWIARPAAPHEPIARASAHWFLDEEERRARAWRGEKAQERAAFRRANLDPEARAEAEKTMRAKRTAP